MPTNEQLDSETAVWGPGANPSVSGAATLNANYLRSTQHASMGDRRKETGTDGHVQLTARIQSHHHHHHHHHGVSDGHLQRRAISARYPRRGDGTINHDAKYAWSSSSSSAGRDDSSSKVWRAKTARSRTFTETCEVEAVRMYNMTSARNDPRRKRHGNVRPKTALGFGDRQNDLSPAGKPQSRNSHFHASPPTFDIDPNIPITSNWDGVKDLNEGKVYDLYRRYLGIEYTPPPRIKSPDGGGAENDDDDADNERDAGDSDERGDSADNSDNATVATTTDGDSAAVNGTLERKVSEARSDVSLAEKENQVGETEETQIKVAQPPQEQRLSLDFPVSLKAVSKVKKSVSRFRRGSKKPETAENNKNSLQLPQLGGDGPHDRRQSQTPAPTLKVKCSAEFQTAMKGLKI